MTNAREPLVGKSPVNNRKGMSKTDSIDRRRLNGEETRNQIINVAQKLFASHGYDGISMRQITVEANVNVASIHYHFGSKENLLLEVLRRGATPLIEERRVALEKLARPLKLEEVVRAYVTPVFYGKMKPGSKRLMFGELRSRLVFENGELADKMLSNLFDDSTRSYVEAIAECVPNLPRIDLYYRFQYLIGAMFYAMSGSRRIQSLSGDICDPSDPEQTINHLTSFVSAGLRAPPGDP